jgi:hypothetical protein
MKAHQDGTFDDYLRHLREVPLVGHVRLLLARHDSSAGELRMVVSGHTLSLKVEHKAGPLLTRPMVDRFLARLPPGSASEWILFATYVQPGLARYLEENKVNFLDRAGNCRLRLGQSHYVQIEGRRPVARSHSDRPLRSTSYQVVFTLLAQPELANAPVRELAATSWCSKSTAADLVQRLVSEGVLGDTRSGRKLLQPRALFDRWLVGYTDVLRPHLLIERFQPPPVEAEALEEHVEEAFASLPETQWAWGGGAACMRLTRFFRGAESIIYTSKPIPDFGKRVRCSPSPTGPLILLHAPAGPAFSGGDPETKTVHPLLVYTDLLASGEPRAREAATELQQEFLPTLQ